MSNEKITLENLFNLLNSVPSADRQAVIEVVYQAAKSKIDELVENYNQVYGFFEQLTAFAVATGEKFNVKKPKRLDFNKIHEFYVDEPSQKELGSSENKQNLEDHPEPAPESAPDTKPQKEEQATQSSESDNSEPNVGEPKSEGEKVGPESETKAEDDEKTGETEDQKPQLSDEELRNNFVSKLASFGCKLDPELASSLSIENLENMLNTFKHNQANAA